MQIEGNTLSLEETIAVIDYDEVRSNHTYAEYTDAKVGGNIVYEVLANDPSIKEIKLILSRVQQLIQLHYRLRIASIRMM